MYNTCGLFRGITCPFFASGLCYRPYCHFKHAGDSAAPARPSSVGCLPLKASDSGREAELAPVVASPQLPKGSGSGGGGGGGAALPTYTPTPRPLLGATVPPPPAYKPTPISELRTTTSAGAGGLPAVAPPSTATAGSEPTNSRLPAVASHGSSRRRPTTIEYDPESNYRTPDGLVDGARHNRMPSVPVASGSSLRAAGQASLPEEVELPSAVQDAFVKVEGASSAPGASEQCRRLPEAAHRQPAVLASKEAESVKARVEEPQPKQPRKPVLADPDCITDDSARVSCGTTGTTNVGPQLQSSDGGKAVAEADVHCLLVRACKQEREAMTGEDREKSSLKLANGTSSAVGRPSKDGDSKRNSSCLVEEVRREAVNNIEALTDDPSTFVQKPAADGEGSSQPPVKRRTAVSSSVCATTADSFPLAKPPRLPELKVVLHRLKDMHVRGSPASIVRRKRRRVLSWSSQSSSACSSDVDLGQLSSHADLGPASKQARHSSFEQASPSREETQTPSHSSPGLHAPMQSDEMFTDFHRSQHGSNSGNSQATSHLSVDRKGSLTANSTSLLLSTVEPSKTTVSRQLSLTSADKQTNKTSTDMQPSSTPSSLADGLGRLGKLVIVSSDEEEGKNRIDKRPSSDVKKAKHRSTPVEAVTGAASPSPAAPMSRGEPMTAAANSDGCSSASAMRAGAIAPVHPSVDVGPVKKRVAHASASPSMKGDRLTSKPAVPKKLTPAEVLQARYDIQKQRASLPSDNTSVAAGKQPTVSAHGKPTEDTRLPSREAGLAGSLVKLMPMKQQQLSDAKSTGQLSKAPGSAASGSRGTFSESSAAAAAAAATVGKTTKSGTRQAHQPSKASLVLLSRPRVKADAHSSRVPVNVRQNCLDRLVDEAAKIYDSVDGAYERAVQDEESAYGRSNSKKVYVNLMAVAVTKLRADRGGRSGNGGVGDAAGPADAGKQPASARLSQDGSSRIKGGSQRPSAGISSGAALVSHDVVLLGKAHGNVTLGLKKKERSSMAEVTAGSLKGSAFYSHLQRYVLTEEQLVDNGFPRPMQGAAGSSASTAVVKWSDKYDKRPQTTGDKKLCARCGKSFIVLPGGLYAKPVEECSYHWGRRIKKKVSGQVEMEYTCCHGNGNAPACVSAKSHVYDSNKYDNLSGFVHPPVSDGSGTAYSLDCEMVYTTAGIELARVTVIDDCLKVVFDAIVRPSHSIVDCNTRFSGLTEESFHGVTTTFHEARSRLLKIINSRTILIGHSLENDLRSLKLFHDQVVDTSVVFPHRLGPPLKRPLRDLVAESLMKIIQDDGDTGHDSAADARACMELMKWKVTQDIKKELR